MILKDEVLRTGGNVIKFLALPLCTNLWLIWVLFSAIEGEKKRTVQSGTSSSISHTVCTSSWHEMPQTPKLLTPHTSELAVENQGPEDTFSLLPLLELWDENMDVPNSWDFFPHLSKDMIVFNLRGNQAITSCGSQSQSLEYNPFCSEPNFPFRARLPWHLETILTHPSNPLD